MTFPVFTRDELPAPYETWPEHPSKLGGPAVKAQPVHGVFGVERDDGTIQKCAGGFGFLIVGQAGLGFIPLAEFVQRFEGADHVADQL